MATDAMNSGAVPHFSHSCLSHKNEQAEPLDWWRCRKESHLDATQGGAAALWAHLLFAAEGKVLYSPPRNLLKLV